MKIIKYNTAMSEYFFRFFTILLLIVLFLSIDASMVRWSEEAVAAFPAGRGQTATLTVGNKQSYIKCKM